MQDIDHILSLELRKEIADRYFGLRKSIEDDIQRYDEQLNASLDTMENTIGFNLIRIYTLLHFSELIKKFQELTGLSSTLFFDPYLLESNTIKQRIFNKAEKSWARGFTKKQKFTNLLYALYQELYQAIDEYRHSLEQLMEEEETIAEEIKLFYRNNDLSTIMGFLRHLDRDTPHDGFMAGDIMVGRDKKLDDKMHIQPPQKPDSVLPVIPALPPLKEIKKQLAHLAHRAFDLQGHPDTGLLFQHS
ncbi:hypothetical protein [Desulfogranum japonicum]|uniref:hypothetical protein n=1 Tax=Desulfogranum japonicum TaxID=231447 RepID=UPI00040D3D2E|nr:hypothetical protein [Desulfogranum japonicum]